MNHRILMTTTCFVAVSGFSTAMAQVPSSSAATRVATAEQASANAQPAELQEIVVTAQKRSERLSDVGITMSAPSPVQLANAGVTDVSELSRVVPGFTSAETFSGFPVFSLRGVNFNAGQISAPPAVSVYVDEAPLPYSVMTSGILLDLERVEVLKGPQGTLFGQNATGGSVNVIAAKPTSQFSAGLRSEINNFGETMLEGYVSGPITDTLRARFAATTTQFGAWQKGYHLNDQSNGSQNKSAARLLLDWTPNDRLKVSFNLNANYDHSEAQQPQPNQIAVANPAGAFPGLLSYPLATKARQADFQPGLETRVRDNMVQAVVRADYDLSPDVTLTSITNYVRSKTYTPQDLDGTALPIAIARYGGDVETITQEARLSGSIFDSKLHYVAGVNYEHDKIYDFESTTFDNYSGLPPGAELFPSYHLTNEATAVFGNLDYKILPNLTATGGIRFTSTRQTISGCTFDGGNGVAAATFAGIAQIFNPSVPTSAFVPGGCITINNVGSSPNFQPIKANRAQDESNVSWRAGLNYKLNLDSLLYASISRGYKAGVFSVANTIFEEQIQPLKQEELTDYEVGAKISMFQHRLQFNAAYFYYDYKNKQFYTYIPAPPIGTVSTLVNIPHSKEQGIDVDATARPFAGLTLSAAVTYIKTKTGAYQGFDFQQHLANFDGKEFNFAPPVSATFDVEYKHDIGAGLEGFIGAGGLYNSRTYADLGEVAATRLPSFFSLNARLGVNGPSGWSASIWARNLTNAYYWNNILPGTDVNTKFSAMPRTVGVAFSYKY